MHDGCSKSHTLFPTSRQFTRDLILSLLQSGELEDPVPFCFTLILRHAVYASEKLEVLPDGKIVVKREFLRHVANALADGRGSQFALLAGQLHTSRRWLQQAAKHLNHGRLAGPVCAKQTVDLAVLHLN